MGEFDHGEMATMIINEKEKLPVQPSKPLESECCGTGCTPCVFDIYEKQMRKWEEECKIIRAKLTGRERQDPENSPEDTNCLTPEKYLSFKLISVTADTATTNIYRFSSVPVREGVCNDSLNSVSDDIVEVGQHVVIKIGTEAKPFTVLAVASVSNRSYFDIIIKIYQQGVLTPLISKLVPDDLVLMRGPFGKTFHLKPNVFQNVIILAAGTGIAPMYRIVERILNNEDDYTKVQLIYCNRSIDNILLKSKLREWTSFWNFRVAHYLTRNGNAIIPYGMEVHLKKFTFSDFTEVCSSGIENSFFLVCGTKSFEKDMVNYMNRAKVSSERQHVF